MTPMLLVRFLYALVLAAAGAVIYYAIEWVFRLITGHGEAHPVMMTAGALAVLFALGVGRLRLPLPAGALLLGVCYTAMELVLGIILLEHMGVRLWNYCFNFLNYRGFICLKFSLIWCALGAGLLLLLPRLRLRPRMVEFTCIVSGDMK